jgi:peptide/nickel transport system substrate-binding protein
VGNDNWGLTEFVGTGPYKFESMVRDSEIVLVRNPDYKWGPEWTGNTGPGYPDKIVYKFIPEGATRTAALETGEIDFMDDVPPIDFKNLKSNGDFITVELPQPGSGWAIMWNHERFPTDQLSVRRAMQLAMDRQGMIDTVFNGIGSPACSPLTSVLLCYDKSMCDQYPTDLEKAKQVLEDDGWKDTNGDGIREKDGKELAIDYYFRSDDNLSVEMSSFLKDNFAKIGIKVNLFGLARTGYFDAVRAGKHNSQGWWETGTDPDLVRVLVHSKNAGGGTNRNNYRNPEMDKLIDEAAAEPDVAKRCQLYSQIQQKFKDEAIMEFWVDPMILYATSKNLNNVMYYAGGNTPYFYVASVNK